MTSFFHQSIHAVCPALAVTVLATAALSQAQAGAVSDQGTWETTLQGRDLDGNASTFEAYYDTVLNTTWLADARYFQTQGIDADGAMSWESGKLAVSRLNINGYTGWRLPSVKPLSGTSFTSADLTYGITSTNSEMAHLYHVTLGNKSLYDMAGNRVPDGGLVNTGPFNNLSTAGTYWLGAQVYNYPAIAARFEFSTGAQYGDAIHRDGVLWPVFSGDIAVVPEPQTHALMGLGLVALACVCRQRRQF